MKSYNLKPTADLGLLLLRLMVGGAFIAHGAQKLFGAFGGPGMKGFMGFVGTFGLWPAVPSLWAWAAALAEFIGGIAILLGLLTGIAGIFIIIDMLVAIFSVHLKSGFFIQNGGFEYALTIIIILLALILIGPGKYSVDRFIGWKF